MIWTRCSSQISRTLLLLVTSYVPVVYSHLLMLKLLCIMSPEHTMHHPHSLHNMMLNPYGFHLVLFSVAVNLSVTLCAETASYVQIGLLPLYIHFKRMLSSWSVNINTNTHKKYEILHVIYHDNENWTICTTIEYMQPFCMMFSSKINVTLALK